jgi:hypothetical protein
VTSQESPQRRYDRACERRNLFDAEVALKEMGYVSLPNALRLLSLYAAEDSPKFDAAAVRFLGRQIVERHGNTLGSLQLVAAALDELRGAYPEVALRTLERLL